MRSVRLRFEFNLYFAQGDHLPAASDVPEAIAEALKYIAEHPAPEE